MSQSVRAKGGLGAITRFQRDKLPRLDWNRFQTSKCHTLYGRIISLKSNKWWFCTLMYLHWVCVCVHTPLNDHPPTPPLPPPTSKSNLAVTLNRQAQLTYEVSSPSKPLPSNTGGKKKISCVCAFLCTHVCVCASARTWFNSLSVKRVSASDRNTATPWENTGQHDYCGGVGWVNFFIFYGPRCKFAGQLCECCRIEHCEWSPVRWEVSDQYFQVWLREMQASLGGLQHKPVCLHTPVETLVLERGKKGQF